jgi:futalosine hydrolase
MPLFEPCHMGMRLVHDRILVVTALAEEAHAVVGDARSEPCRVGPYEGFMCTLGRLTVLVVVSGIGATSAAAATATGLATAGPFDLVLSAGIAGGLSEECSSPGQLVVADEIVAMDTDDGTNLATVDLAEDIVWPNTSFKTSEGFVKLVLGAVKACRGGIVTVPAVTVTDASAAELADTYRAVVAEAMEGAGMATAATRWGVAIGELRAVSNAVGAPEHSNWDMETALSSLRAAMAVILGALARG